MDIAKAFIIYKNQGPDALVNILLHKDMNFREIHEIMKKVKKLDVIYEQVKLELMEIDDI